MKLLQLFWSHLMTALKTFSRAVWHEYYPLLFVALFFGILFILQWLFEYEQFYHIVILNEAGLSFAEILDVLIEALISLFRYPDDLTPIALIAIAFFQSAIVLMWIRSRQLKHASKVTGALGLGLLGAGCVACAGSLLGVLLSSVGAVLSVTLVQTLGDILLVLAVLLSIKAFVDIGVSTAGYIK